MNIAIIGTGYVGLVTGVCFAEFGVTVTCVDKDAERIERLSRGIPPIFEPRLGEMLTRNLNEGRLRFTTDADTAVQQSLVVFVAVGTPSLHDGSADLGDLMAVARTIATNLNGYKVIVTKSTVPVGTSRRVEAVIRQHSGHGGHVFDVASNPEFLREGSAIEDFLRPNRVVIGADSPQAVAILQDLYRPLYLIETPIVVTTPETAELIKYASNSFLAVKIGFINEMANLCESLGVDVHTLAKAMGLDQRIGPKFLHPGPGYGGSCFPKDTRALTQIARAQGLRTQIVEAAVEVNERQKLRMVDKILAALGSPPTLEGVTVGVLGLAFKPNTNDMREAPSLVIARELQSRGAQVQAYDPEAMADAKAFLPDIQLCQDAYGAADGADALVLVTEWNQFRNLDLGELKRRLHRPILVDLRNVYDRERAAAAGFEYHAVGRP
jgi:UDPglucose 6-dehydrogenase